jgi:hypothetical protein
MLVCILATAYDMQDERSSGPVKGSTSKMDVVKKETDDSENEMFDEEVQARYAEVNPSFVSCTHYIRVV